MRIVSLIPEATEILRALGLGDRTVSPSLTEVEETGWTWDRQTRAIFTSETPVGGGLPRHQVRRSLARAGLKPRPAVYALEPHTLGDLLSDIKTVGDAVGRQREARAAIEALRARIDAVSLRSALALAEAPPRRVVCLQGDDPPVAAGWWLAELVGLAGGIDVLDGVGRPPRPVTWEQIRAAGPDLVIRMDLTPPTPLSGAERGETLSLLPPLRAGEGGWGGEVVPGPRSVDLLEQFMAPILQDRSGSLDLAARRPATASYQVFPGEYTNHV